MDCGLVNITRIMGVVGGRPRRQGTPPIILGPPMILSSHPPACALRPCRTLLYGPLCRRQRCVGLERLEPPRCARSFVLTSWGAGGPRSDRYVEGFLARPVASGVAQELCDGLGWEVADGDDAVVAGCSAQRGLVGPAGAAPDGDAGSLEWTGEEANAVGVKMAAGMVH